MRINDRHPSAAADFAEAARGYCRWCEGSVLTDVEAAAWLCRLYASALGLPEVGPENEEGLPDLPAEGLARAEAALASFNGRYYREVFDPDPSLTEEAVVGDLGDDLLDIYKDVRRGLLVYERGDVTDALWHWSFLHRIHWGRHAAGALLALHCLSLSRAE